MFNDSTSVIEMIHNINRNKFQYIILNIIIKVLTRILDADQD